MAETTLADANLGATPKTPMPPAQDHRTILALDLGTTTGWAIEEVRRHAGTDAAHVFGGLLAVLTSWGELRGVPYQGVPVGTIKKFLTGQGNANKQAMIDAARKRGFSPVDDNEADAIAILLWALETQGGLG